METLASPTANEQRPYSYYHTVSKFHVASSSSFWALQHSAKRYHAYPRTNTPLIPHMVDPYVYHRCNSINAHTNKYTHLQGLDHVGIKGCLVHVHDGLTGLGVRHLNTSDRDGGVHRALRIQESDLFRRFFLLGSLFRLRRLDPRESSIFTRRAKDKGEKLLTACVLVIITQFLTPLCKPMNQT